MAEERVLPVVGGENFRELGGYRTKDGRSIKWKKIIRSASLNELTSEDQNYLSEYGVRTVVDFRSSGERADEPDKEIPLAHNLFMPVFKMDETKNSIEPKALIQELIKNPDGTKQMKQVNRNFVVEPHSLQTYSDFFKVLLKNTEPDQSVLFHCTAGKDRTGFAAAIFLTAMGVDQETIMTDYLLTNQCLVKKVDQVVTQAQQAGAPTEVVTAIREIFSAQPEYLENAFKTIAENYDSFDLFLSDGLKISTEELNQLKETYLD